MFVFMGPETIKDGLGVGALVWDSGDLGSAPQSDPDFVGDLGLRFYGSRGHITRKISRR